MSYNDAGRTNASVCAEMHLILSALQTPVTRLYTTYLRCSACMQFYKRQWRWLIETRLSLKYAPCIRDKDNAAIVS